VVDNLNPLSIETYLSWYVSFTSNGAGLQQHGVVVTCLIVSMDDPLRIEAYQVFKCCFASTCMEQQQQCGQSACP